jgi:hypothetical protein
LSPTTRGRENEKDLAKPSSSSSNKGPLRVAAVSTKTVFLDAKLLPTFWVERVRKIGRNFCGIFEEVKERKIHRSCVHTHAVLLGQSLRQIQLEAKFVFT